MKYRIKKVTNSYSNVPYYYVQFKFFLFWHTYRDAWGDKYDFNDIEYAKSKIESLKSKDTVEIINIK